MRILAGAAATCACLGGLACGRTPDAVTVERAWPVMGTVASVRVEASSEAEGERAVEAVRAAFDRVDRAMSNWSPVSELSRLNVAAARSGHRFADAGLRDCVALALSWAARTGGAFDPTVGPLVRAWGFRPHAPRVPEASELAAARLHVGWSKVRLTDGGSAVVFSDVGVELDLGGIAKGCALDTAQRELAGLGIGAALLDLGGNLLARGRPRDGPGWRIGLRDPFQDGAILASVEVTDASVATSSNGENSFTHDGVVYGHLLDPRSGRPAAVDVVSATAIARRGGDADALSTALFVLGRAGSARLLDGLPDVEAVLLVREPSGLALLASRRLEGRVRLAAGATARGIEEVRFTLD